MVPPDSCRVSPAPHYSGSFSPPLCFTYGPVTLCGAAFQAASIHTLMACEKSYNPASGKPDTVWAVSRSLATTWEITVVFSSFSYLDVSVRRVCPPRKEYPDHSGWVAPFGHPWINASLQLPMAFRSLARPSSPLYAKASTVRPFLLIPAWLAPTLVPAKQQQTHELDYFYLDLTKLYNAPGMDASSQIYLPLRQRTLPA
jgi:hypothetical protein